MSSFLHLIGRVCANWVVPSITKPGCKRKKQFSRYSWKNCILIQIMTVTLDLEDSKPVLAWQLTLWLMICIITWSFGFKMFSGSDECTIKLGLAAKYQQIWLWSLTVTLTLRRVTLEVIDQSFYKTLWLMMMYHYITMQVMHLSSQQSSWHHKNYFWTGLCTIRAQWKVYTRDIMCTVWA